MSVHPNKRNQKVFAERLRDVMELKQSRLLCLLFVASTIAGAQTTSTPDQLDLPRSSDPGKTPFIRTVLYDEWRMWSSPFRKSNYDTHTIKKYIIPFSI